MCVKGCHEVVAAKLNRRALVRGAAALGGVAALGRGGVARAAPREARQLSYRSIVDLTHTFTTTFPVYGEGSPTRQTIVTVPDDGFYIQEWTFAEHSGTHMDAPGHFIEDGRRVPDLHAEELVAPLVVVDIRARAAVDPDAMVTIDDLRRWERGHGRIRPGACVAMYSGWEQYVGDQDEYRGTDPDGVYHFPGFGLDAVDFLISERQIQGIAVDTLSLDIGASATFDVHYRLLGADLWGLENVANLGQLRPKGATIVAGVIPWEEGSGGPCRVLAFG